MPVHFRLEQLQNERIADGKPYLECFRNPSMSVGIYGLRKEEEDRQRPHTEDEMYYVIAGQAQMKVGDESFPVGPGSVIFVEAGLEHRFHAITEDLTVLVVFAPAEYTNRG